MCSGGVAAATAVPTLRVARRRNQISGGDRILRQRRGADPGGEGRWTAHAAIDEGVPAPVLTSALFSRFASRGEDEFANKVLSAMRFAFGGHLEQHS